MANLHCSLELSGNWDKAVRAGINTRMAELVWERCLFRSQNICLNIGEYLATVFNATPVAKALRGELPGTDNDLAAHFGLTNDQAAALAEDMATVIRESVRLRENRRPGEFPVLIEIAAIRRGYNEFLELPNAEYVSKGGLVPLMRWMLLDPSIDPVTALYEIVFGQDATTAFGLTVVLRNSRSGRAIMLLPDKVAKLRFLTSGPYVLPDLLQRMGEEENFIEYAVNQPGAALECMNILVANL